MVFEITIPRLGWSMDEGTFVRWLKQDGDSVRAGEPLFELEGEKAAQDIEALDSGVLRIPPTAPAPGSLVAVGIVIGYLVGDGEAPPREAASVQHGHVAELDPATISPLAATAVTSERVRIKDAIGTEDSVVASPRARRVAHELGIDWRKVNGTGRNARVRERDVRAAGGRQEADAASSIPISSRRRTIADRMMASRERTAPVTLTTRVDAANLVSLRGQFKSAAGGMAIPTYTDIVLKLVAVTLQQHPLMAARWQEDQLAMPSLPDGLHLGFAVDTEDGLLVPVVRNVDALGLVELARQTHDLVDRARSGRLTATAMQGGVFTITNLGAFGVDAFTPIINSPETAILGLGRIIREAVVRGEQIVARDQITLSLTFDHRVVDGAPGARFLQAVGHAIENPSASLLRAV